MILRWRTWTFWSCSMRRPEDPGFLSMSCFSLFPVFASDKIRSALRRYYEGLELGVAGSRLLSVLAPWTWTRCRHPQCQRARRSSPFRTNLILLAMLFFIHCALVGACGRLFDCVDEQWSISHRGCVDLVEAVEALSCNQGALFDRGGPRAPPRDRRGYFLQFEDEGCVGTLM